MRCANCQHENRESAKFCKACGAKLELVCPACGTRNELGAAFCDNCGARLGESEKDKREKGEKENGQSRLRTANPGLWTPSHLVERIWAEQAAIEARGASEGERKTITALFADIKD